MRMHLITRFVVVGAAALSLMGLGCAERRTGPWDLGGLKKPPKVEWVDRAGQVRGLYYSGEAYNGHSTRVFAYYAAPAKRSGKAPAMVLVHGGGGKAFPEWAELWAKRGYAAIAMDLAGCGPDGKRMPDGGPDQSHEEKFTALNRGIHEAWPYHAVADVIRAHSLLRSMPEVDAARTGITGISWGGYLTCIVAGLDDRFKAAVPVYGCGFLNEDTLWTSLMTKLSPADQQRWFDNFDPSRYLPGCRMPILFVDGTNDFAYRLDCLQKSYRLIRGPRTLCVTIKMPHSHPDGWAPKEIGIFVDSALAGGKPLARFEKITRHGRQVRATLKAAVSIKEAALNYTTDQGDWKKRQWQVLPAHIDATGTVVTAELPADNGIAYFINVKDERGAVVSTEHDAL
jgi:dienelactone hydrolase